MGRLTLPRLHALNRYWRKHPPTHLLVAAYLGYEEPTESQPADADDGPMPAIAGMGGMGGMTPTPELQQATSQADALAAAERMFFGNLMEM